MTDAYPLAWPAGQPRTKNPVDSKFQATVPQALQFVHDELRRFGKDTGKPVKNLVLSSNVTLTSHNPSDGGVAAYFQWDGLDCCIAVDRYKRVRENLQAIGRVIEADRAKMRHGGLNIVRAAFRGYAALPPPSDGKPWHVVLGVDEGGALVTARAAYKRLAAQCHPDAGGSDERMAEVNRAWDEAQRALA